jgi:hypothetical protein
VTLSAVLWSREHPFIQPASPVTGFVASTRPEHITLAELSSRRSLSNTEQNNYITGKADTICFIDIHL